MKVTVTKQFRGVKDGDVYPSLIKVGEELTGSLAQTALNAGWAVDERPKKKDVKATDGSASRPARRSRKTTSKKSKAKQKYA